MRGNSEDPRQNEPKTITIHTIVETAVDSVRCVFETPTTIGSFLTLDQAVKDLEELIPMAREKLDDRYDMESRDTCYWEAYQDGYGADCFLRLEIVCSELTLSVAELLRCAHEKEACGKPNCGKGRLP